MNHVEECFLAKPCRHNDGVHVPQEFVGGFPVTICGLCMNDCICKELLSAGARGYKAGNDDGYNEGYDEGYERGYDAALANHVCETFIVAPKEGFDWPPDYNQHGQGENP